MSVTWTIEVSGVERPLKSWGIRSAVLTLRSLDADVLSLWVPRDDVITETPDFAYGAAVILRRDAVRWFSGTVLKSAVELGARTEGDRVTIVGPWWQLQRTVYQQRRCIAGAVQMTPRICLGQNRFGQRISVQRQIAEILIYALTQGIGITAGLMPVGNEPWLEEAQDITCAGAILRMLRYLPHAVGWFDYSGATPVLNIRTADLLAAASLDVTAGDAVVEISGLASRSDLIPVGVTFIYEDAEVDEEVDSRKRTTITRHSAGVANVPGAIVATIRLRDDEAVVAGLAAAYYAALQTPVWEGNLRVLEEDCTGAMRPGKLLNLTNGRAAWATMSALIQSVTEDLTNGETMVECGAPEHLDPQDFVTQQQLARRRAVRSAFPRVQPCTIADPEGDPGDPEEGVDPDEAANPDAGVEPETIDVEDGIANLNMEGAGTIELEACQDGSPICVRVIGGTVSCS